MNLTDIIRTCLTSNMVNKNSVRNIISIILGLTSSNFIALYVQKTIRMQFALYFSSLPFSLTLSILSFSNNLHPTFTNVFWLQNPTQKMKSLEPTCHFHNTFHTHSFVQETKPQKSSLEFELQFKHYITTYIGMRLYSGISLITLSAPATRASNTPCGRGLSWTIQIPMTRWSISSETMRRSLTRRSWTWFNPFKGFCLQSLGFSGQRF